MVQPTHWLVRGSVHVYRWLLVAYPRGFRESFGPQMVQVFRDTCRAAYRRRGVLGVGLLWGHAIGDLLRAALAERMQTVA